MGGGRNSYMVWGGKLKETNILKTYAWMRDNIKMCLKKTGYRSAY
jgi:hypothetical protein